MVKVKKKDLCGTCRKRKIQCDGKSPACSQCIFSHRKCEGYLDALFVPFDPNKPTGSAKAPRGALTSTSPKAHPVRPSCPLEISSPRTEPKPSFHISTSIETRNKTPSISPTDPKSLAQQVSLILRNFVPWDEAGCGAMDTSKNCSRFCGSWAMALPDLVADETGPFTECLHAAVKALALAITAYRTRERMLHSVSTQYELSLRFLGNGLAVSGNVYDNKLAATVMCLALLEILSPTQPANWMVHVEGVTKIIQLSTPELFETGLEHTLFMGFRPLLILKSFFNRKANFFADDSWARLPFQNQQVAPLQSLLGVVAQIPAILEMIDATASDSSLAASSSTRQLLTEMEEGLARLEFWYSNFLQNASDSLYWHRTVERGPEGDFQALWYPDLSTANAFTYYWTFRIICLDTIGSLSQQHADVEEFVPMTRYGNGALHRERIEISVHIYQSMEYILQERFMLYGLASASVPLEVACKALESTVEGRGILETLDQSIVSRTKIWER